MMLICVGTWEMKKLNSSTNEINHASISKNALGVRQLKIASAQSEVF